MASLRSIQISDEREPVRTVSVSMADYSLKGDQSTTKVALTQNNGLPLYPNNTAFTIAGWINIPNTNVNHTIFSEGSGSGTSPVILFDVIPDAPGCVRYLVRNDSATSLVTSPNTTKSLKLKRWYHVALVDNDGDWEIFIDGRSALNSDGAYNYTRTGSFTITKSTLLMLSRNTDSNPSGAKHKDQRIYTRALSSDEIVALSNNQTVDDTGLIRQYLFNEGSGSTAMDSSSSSDNVSITGGSYTRDYPQFDPRTSTTNRFLLPSSAQKTLAFNGTTSYATTDIAPATTGFSFGIWLKNITLGANTYVLSYTNASNGGFHLYQIASTNRLFFQIFNTTTNEVNASAGTGTTFGGRWQHFVCTFAPNDFKMYLNRVLIATDTSCAMTDPSVAQLLTIGRRSYSSGSFSNIYAYRFTLQNSTTPWTQAQIDDLYWRNIIPTGATQWSLNDTLLDQNGQNALTASGTSFVSDAPLQPRSAV